ncbi:MAG: hypothetical protein M1G31_33700 [Pseudanabaena sp. Salubria-1]|nr:hypothetical protein [Pseudanabaena sp. Salubria-1]MCL1495665.1 hypothetical protein [Pseudanabaena sp. Salubria-1]
MVTGMDLYLDRLLNLPNTTVESFTEEENKITLKLRFLQDEITCPHCNTHGGKLKQNGSSGFKGISKSNEKDKLII